MEELKLNIDEAVVKTFAQRVQKVLFENIIPFWLSYSRDDVHGGYWGRVNNRGLPVKDAPKGLILNSRILWTFSVLYGKYREAVFLEMAQRAREYLMKYFWDQKFGGMFWLLDVSGSVLDDKKKMYGQAFTIYAISEYYRITRDPSLLQRAIDIFDLMLKHNFDRKHGGFLETSGRNWTPARDMRLSDKDLNAEKSMNTHLHLLEAFTAFYRVWPESVLKDQLRQLVEHFLNFIFNERTGHLNLFFDQKWQVKSRGLSFGHDIEASWLLLETLKVLKDETLSEKGKKVAITLAESTLRDGLTADYAIYKERTDNGRLIPVLEWWQQAEAVVGFTRAFLLSGRLNFWNAALKTWDFLEEHVVDWQNGEWFYEVDMTGRPNPNTFKISEWKGPYHNVRACLEILNCLEELKGQKP